MHGGASNGFAWGMDYYATTGGITVSCGSSKSYGGGYAIVEYVGQHSVSPIILYENESATKFSGAITLSESAANLSRILIEYIDTDDICGSVTVSNPNEKLVCLNTNTFTSGSAFYHKSKIIKISGKTVDTYYNGGYWTGQTNATGATTTNDNYVGITKVVGWKL